MINWIENFQDAKQLYVCWKAPENSKDRTHWAVGIVSLLPDGEFDLRYLRDADEFAMHNGGKALKQLEALGFAGFPAFSLRRNHIEGVREAFMRRLPPRKRPDFADFLEKFRLKPETVMSDFSLLARTEAKSPGDNFSFVDPLKGYTKPCDFLLEVAGYRYCSGEVRKEIRVGQSVSFALEPDNQFDSHAVKILVEEQCIGYINRLQTSPFEAWLKDTSVKGVIERLNGTAERPRAFIFLRAE